MKTLYLHIGMPKTGTTAIQEFCWYNREALEHYGYCFPDMSEICPEWRKPRNGHFLIYGWEDKSQGIPASDTWNKYREGMEIVKNKFSDYDNIILSEESIYRATNGVGRVLWKELKADGEKYGFQVKIVVYLRRQDEFLVSQWKQGLKRRTTSTVPFGSQKTWDEYLEMAKNWKHLDYYKKLRSVVAAFGKENLIVRRYDRGGFLGNSIYVDFLDAIGLEMKEEFEIAEEERNPSLYGNTCEIMRVLNCVSALNEEDRAFVRDLLFIDGEVGKAEYPNSMFSKEECREFLERYRESNRRVAEEYLGEKDADLFNDKIPDLPKWTPDNPYMQQDIIRVMALGFKQLREENARLLQNQRLLQKRFAQEQKGIVNRAAHAIGRRMTKKGGGRNNPLVYGE